MYYEHIWLDDVRYPNIPLGRGYTPGEPISWVKTYDEFVSEVKRVGKRISDCLIHFDHDLGEDKDGYDCAKWLIDWCLENDYGVPDYDVQSANPVGRKNIESVFESYWKVFFENNTKDYE